MLSFFGEQSIKDSVVARVREHQRLDQIIQGTYWDGQKGCAIGCVLHSGDHGAYETQLGLPVFLAYIDEHIFERLSVEDSKGWPLRFIEAVPVGVDLDMVFPRFMYWLLTDPQGMRQYANAKTVPIIDRVAQLYADRLTGQPFDGAAARDAAGSARAAAGDAARAARDAAGSAGDAAGDAAGAARDAARAAIHRQADYLIALLQSYESVPTRHTSDATTKEAAHDLRPVGFHRP